MQFTYIDTDYLKRRIRVTEYYNKVVVVGAVGDNVDTDYQTRYLPSGDLLVAFRVATEGSVPNTDRVGRVHHRTWFDIITQGNLANFASRQVSYGSIVYVEGSLGQVGIVTSRGVHELHLVVDAQELRILDALADDGKLPNIDNIPFQLDC